MDNLLKDHRCPIHGAVLSRHDWAIAQRAIRLPRRVPHVPLLGHGFSLSLTLRACPETIEVRHLDRSAPNHVISTGAKRSGETPVFRPGSCRCPLLKSGISCESVVASLPSRNRVPPRISTESSGRSPASRQQNIKVLKRMLKWSVLLKGTASAVPVPWHQCGFSRRGTLFLQELFQHPLESPPILHCAPSRNRPERFIPDRPRKPAFSHVKPHSSSSERTPIYKYHK